MQLTEREVNLLQKLFIELNARLRPLDNFVIPKLRWEVITAYFALFDYLLLFSRGITAEGYYVEVCASRRSDYDYVYGFDTDEVWVPTPLMVELCTSECPTWDVLGYQKPFKSIFNKHARETALDEAIAFVFRRHNLPIDPDLQI